MRRRVTHSCGTRHWRTTTMTDVQTRTDAELASEEPNRPDTASTRRVVLLGAGGLGAACVLAARGPSPTAGSNTNGSDFTDNPAPAGSAGAAAGGSGDAAGG